MSYREVVTSWNNRRRYMAAKTFYVTKGIFEAPT